MAEHKQQLNNRQNINILNTPHIHNCNTADEEP